MQVHHWQLPGGSLLVFFTPFDNGQKTIQQLIQSCVYLSDTISCNTSGLA